MGRVENAVGGRHYVNEGSLLFEFDDDRIKHARAYQDFGSLLEWPFLEGRD